MRHEPFSRLRARASRPLYLANSQCAPHADQTPAFPELRHRHNYDGSLLRPCAPTSLAVGAREAYTYRTMEKVLVSQHVRDALDQVRLLQQTILERIRFHGFSGPTRAASGTLALCMAVLMSTPFYPDRARTHLLGWGAVLAVALFLNGGAVLYWFLNDPSVHRHPRRLRPVLDVIPPLFVGGVMTAALVLRGELDLLFGVWMLTFGLANLASRHVLPRAINFVGLFYVFSGMAWMLAPQTSFMNPWAMGFVFFAGEWAGGLILYVDDKRMERAAPRYFEEEPANET